MQKNYMTVRSAAILSLGINLIFILPFFMIFLFGNFIIFGSGSLILEINEQNYMMIFFSFFFNCVFVFLLFMLNFNVLNRNNKVKKKTVILIITNISGTIILTIFLSIFRFILFRFLGYLVPFQMDILEAFFCNFCFSVVVIFISQIIYLSQKQQQIAIQYEALATENIRIKYEALKSQIDPHFLFNTLSILDSLVAIDQRKAQEYIQKFSSTYRYMLQNKDVVVLDDELEFTYNYCDLMSIRYGESLAVNFKIDDKYKKYFIASLGLQTLVENAIKHNIISKQKQLVIDIETTGEGLLTVSNNYQPKDVPSAGAGIGLANLSERYLLKWQEKIQIEKTDTLFRVSLPLIKS